MNQMNLDQLLDLPWSWHMNLHMQDEQTWFELTIDELPGYLVAGRTLEEVESEKRDVLRAFLESRTEHDDRIALPVHAARWRSIVVMLEDEFVKEEPIRTRLQLLPI